MNSEEIAEIDFYLEEIKKEYERASVKFGAFHSTHEGYGVIKEEFDEMWDEIKINRIPKARKECIQLAAMALRFLIDIRP